MLDTAAKCITLTRDYTVLINHWRNGGGMTHFTKPAQHRWLSFLRKSFSSKPANHTKSLSRK
jgi:hypothetical protein